MQRINHDSVELYRIDDFLSQIECNELIKRIDANNQRSMVSSDGATHSVVSDYRTSSTSNLDQNCEFVKSIDDRIRLELDTSDHGEVIQGQKYEVGQEFKNHTDYFDGDTYDLHCTNQNLGNRSWTFMIYLNDVPEGGSTSFPNLGERFTPKMGTAIVWRNTDILGNPFVDTIHSGDPVLKGTKYIITKWFRNPLSNNSKTFTNLKDLPKFTELGFSVMDVPSETWGLIREGYELMKSTIKPEFKTQAESNSSAVTGSVADIISWDRLPTLRNLIQKQLLPFHQEWCGEELDTSYLNSDGSKLPTPVYGIRSYNSGAVLTSHVDRIRSHHISAIILVDEQSNKSWGLDIQGNDGNWYNVVIKPGQMILYESATCEHGRLTPFDGEYFRNFFVHYTLKNYTYVG